MYCCLERVPEFSHDEDREDDATIEDPADDGEKGGKNGHEVENTASGLKRKLSVSASMISDKVL